MSDTVTTTTTANDVVGNALIEKQVLAAARPAVVAANKVTLRNLPRGVLATTFPKFQALTAAALSEGTQQDASGVTTDGVTVTADLVGITVNLSDKLRDSSVDMFSEQVILEMGRAIANKLDSDILGLATGFSTVVGSSGVDLTIQNLLDAMYSAEAADMPDGNTGDPSSFGLTPEGLRGKMIFLHPIQIADLRAAIVTSSAPIFSDPEAQDVCFQNEKGLPVVKPKGYVGKFFGIPVFQSTNCPASDTNANRNGMLIVPSAIGLAVKYLAQYEQDRDLRARASLHGLTSFYGYAELVDAYGVRIRSDY